MKTLILGLGNTLISDDGVGIIIKRYLERKFNNVTNIDFCESSWGGFRIVDLFQNYDYAIVIDAIKTETKPEGYIHRLKPADFLHTLRLTSYHDINFITAIKLGESMSFKMPQDIDIFAIEIEDNYSVAETLNPKIIQTVGKCSAEIYKILTSKGLIEDNIDMNSFNEINSEADLKELYKEEFSETEQY